MLVTRAYHDAIIARLEASLTHAREEFHQQLKYNQTLVQQIVDMRREGFAPTPQAAPRAADPVKEAIALASNGDRSLWRHLSGEAAKMRREGKDEEEIAGALLNWQSDEDGIPSADLMTAGD